MGFAGIDDAFELGVGQQAIGDHIGRQMRPVGGLGRRDRGHRGRLHEPGRMRLRSGNADRLQAVSFIQRLGDAAAFGGLPVDRLVGEFDALGFDRGGRDGDGAPRGIVFGASRERASSDARSDSGRDRQSRRNLRRHPVEQHGRIGRHAGRSRKRRRIVGRHAVDDGQARVGRRAMARINAAIDGGGEHDAAALLQVGRSRRARPDCRERGWRR